MQSGKIGWVLSAVLHIGVVVVVLVGMPQFSRELPPPPPPINIEFVKIAEQTRQLVPEAKQAEKPADEKPQKNYAKAENVPPPPADVAPILKPVKPKKAEPKPAPKPKPQLSETRILSSNVIPKAKPRPPSRLKSNRIAALIDRSLKDEEEQELEAEKKQEEKQKAEQKKESINRLESLRGTVATASLKDALSQKLAGCWTFPRGAKGVEKMQVTVRIWLRPDGTLSRPPEFVGVGDLNAPDKAFYRVYAESARRAVRLCEPFDEASQYIGAGQKYIDFNFNGAEFTGGQ